MNKFFRSKFSHTVSSYDVFSGLFFNQIPENVENYE